MSCFLCCEKTLSTSMQSPRNRTHTHISFFCFPKTSPLSKTVRHCESCLILARNKMSEQNTRACRVSSASRAYVSTTLGL